MIGNVGVTEWKDGAGTMAPRRDSQTTLEGMRLVRRDVWTRGSEAFSKRTGRSNVEIKNFADRQRESSGGTGNGEVAEVEEGVQKAAAPRGSRRTPEGIRVVRITSDEREETKTKRLDGSAKM